MDERELLEVPMMLRIKMLRMKMSRVMMRSNVLLLWS
jgi:hypothetical protein